MQRNVTSVSLEVTSNYRVPSGAIQVHIAVPTGASCDVDGISLTGPAAFNLPCLAYGANDRRYGDVELTSVSGTIMVRYDK